MRLSWARLALLAFFAALAFGGSFTCSYNDHDHHDHPPQQSK
ncbi:MAG TPA: hypothetical protein VH518_00820 [Tepidisphaeraceae bacterium]